ncbi:hypothetical protein WR25_11369 [Diploscapter pachys]|uniref:MAM domain-containing protein n=1 Tax=Diploscapter pachys TaxID=2018661 RepID=A0A2A2JLF8_9BILA|nr:hypothetical protein WR25_11369 [Diploscapter pachys]
MSGSEGGNKAQENKQNQEAVVTTSDTKPQVLYQPDHPNTPYSKPSFQPNIFPAQYTVPHTPVVLEAPQMQKYVKVAIKKTKKDTSKNKKTKSHSSDTSSWDDSSDSSDSSSKSSTSSTQSDSNESSDKTEEESSPGPGKCKACQDIVKYDQVPHLTEVSYARDKDGCRIALINCGRNVRAVMKGVSASDDTLEILQDAEAFTAKTARCNNGGRWEIINSDGNPVEINKVKCWYKRWAVSHLVDQTQKCLKNLLDTDDTEVKAYKDGEKAAHFVMCCLSTRSSSTSCVHYQSPECTAQYQYASQQTGPVASPTYSNPISINTYQGLLGSYVTARAYSGTTPDDEYVRSDRDLSCINALSCSWQNVAGDQLDWLQGEGNVDSNRLQLISGSSVLPDHSFLLLGSTPRPPDHAGLFVSPLIGCQQSSGILSFRYWRRSSSKAMYYGHVDTPDNCAPKNLDSNELEPLNAETEEGEDEKEIHLVSADANKDFYDERHLVSNEINTRKAPQFPTVLPPSKIDEILKHEGQNFNETEEEEGGVGDEIIDDFDMESQNITKRDSEMKVVCRSLQCLYESSNFSCEYSRTGEGAKGEGHNVGWKISTLSKNIANPLTGIVKPPETNDYLYPFFVADFIGFRADPKENRYVLEAPKFSVNDESQTTYLSFKKYLATKGVYLSICEDFDGSKCFWNVYTNSIAPLERKWTKEVVLLPGQLTKFYIITWQSLSEKLNFGQVGLTEIGLFRDSQAEDPLC